MDEQLIFHGGAVKALGDGKVGGYLVRFTTEDEPDLEGEFFDIKTDFGLVDRSTVYYNHGVDPKLGGKRMGDIAALGLDDVGVWIEHQLDERNEYEQAVYQLAEAGKLGWSSGTAGHLVEREEQGKAIHITKWPLGLDASYTPTPADPGNRAMPLKTWAESAKNLEMPLETEPAGQENPQEGDVSGVTIKAESVNVTINQSTPEEEATTEVKTMAEEKETPKVDWDSYQEKTESMIEGKMADMEGKFSKQISDQLTGFLDKISSSPAMKDAGYVSPDSEGKEHEERKSFGDYLLAIKNGNKTRLAEVYGSTKAAKALGEQSGTTGGYLVPTSYEARLLQMAQEAAVIRPLATVIPVPTNTGEIPALNQSTAPTAGKGYSAFAGGVCAYWTAEAGSITSTDPAFRMVEYNINKLAGYTKVSNELLADSALALESILVNLFGRAVAAKEDYAFLRGTGAGEPLGILAAPCTIAVTTNTNDAFMTEDCMAMLAQFWPQPGSSSIRWILNRGLIPDLYLYHTVVTGGTDAVQPTQSLPTQLVGYPIVYSEHMPVANTDDAILADLSAYVIFDRQGMQISYSEHSAFLTDEGVWRFTKRLDGMPWLDDDITLADPGGATTVSPFLYHND